MAIGCDPITGAVVYYSNKFQTGNFQTSVTMGEIRAGLGNAIATILPSDSAVNVEFTAADFNLWAKAAQVGATLNYNAVTMVCQTVTAADGGLTVDVSTNGVPTSQYGYSSPFCYVQQIGVASPIATYGTAYPISSAGVVSGLSGISNGMEYKVWYFVNKASSQVASISTLFNPKTIHFTAQLPVYSNESSVSQNEGSRIGWLYAIVPRLKLGGTATVTGDQSNPDTTSMSGQAVAYDSDVVSAGCNACTGSNLAYYIFTPDDTTTSITGLAVVGGLVTVSAGSTTQIPVKYVMADESLVSPVYTDLAYSATSPPSGTTVTTAGVIQAGETTGDFEITIQYPAQGDPQFTTVTNASVISAGG